MISKQVLSDGVDSGVSLYNIIFFWTHHNTTWPQFKTWLIPVRVPPLKYWINLRILNNKNQLSLGNYFRGKHNICLFDILLLFDCDFMYLSLGKQMLFWIWTSNCFGLHAVVDLAPQSAQMLSVSPILLSPLACKCWLFHLPCLLPSSQHSWTVLEIRIILRINYG